MLCVLIETSQRHGSARHDVVAVEVAALDTGVMRRDIAQAYLVSDGLSYVELLGNAVDQQELVLRI